jgi:small nuclear ribonucleoprotein D3
MASAVTVTQRDGRLSKMENVFVRGGLVKFIVLPDSLKSSPLFKKVQTMHAKKVGTTTTSAPGAKRGGPGKGGAPKK